MDALIVIIQIFAAMIGCMVALISVTLFLQLRWPAPALWLLKLYTSALSPVLAVIGVLCMTAGLTTGSVFIILIGIYVFFVYSLHFFRITRAPDTSTGFEQAFGLDWERRIKPEQKHYFLPGRTLLKLPVVPKPRMEQNIAFATIPGTDRKLLCDVWQPPEHVTPSGLAFIYLHGSAWYFLDKDLGTRPFFRHLAAQGHVIMDVAYRHAPETDMMGMVHDIKRAIAWMKEHADIYQINPNRIVVCGGSAGGHLALLTAYTSDEPLFTPGELQGQEMRVCAVISFYGPTDLEAMYYHTNQHLTTRAAPGRSKKAVPAKMPEWVVKSMGEDYHRLGMDKGFENAGAFAPLLGGHPDECLETYVLYSPVSHVHVGCPPTLLIHGEDDIMAPVRSTRVLHKRLVDKKVPTILHLLPQTDHAFDLQLPNISPSAHNAIYDVERFLALVAPKQRLEKKITATSLVHADE